jgi:hypothetical protein
VLSLNNSKETKFFVTERHSKKDISNLSEENMLKQSKKWLKEDSKFSSRL